MGKLPIGESASFPAQLAFRDELLQGRDFSGRNLVGTVFAVCDLTDADFSGADLDKTTFSDCRLVGASLRRTSLRGATFRDCTGLTAKQFAGAQLEGAVLPDAIATPPGLARISEISKRAYALLVPIVGGCLASGLVISRASDISLLANIGSLPVPGTEIKVPTASFFVMMPLIIGLLWAFFQITLMRLWQEFADLPEVFPDGEALYRKADFWLFGGYVSGWNVADLANTEWLRLVVFYILAWWLVPCTLLSFWASYLRRHDMIGTSRQIFVISLVALFGTCLTRKINSIILRGETVGPSKLFLIANGFVITSIMALYFLSNAAVNGVADFDRPDSLAQHDVWYRRVGQGILRHLYIRTQSSLRGVILDDDQKDLNGADIKYSNAANFSAPSANLREARLTGINLSNAALNGAHLERANLQYSELYETHLEGAFFRDAHLELSDAKGAFFDAAHLNPAGLEEADLRDADFRDADLSESDFRGADLRRAKFNRADLSKVNFYMADLRDADFTGARNINKIDCLALANIAGTVGLILPEVSEKGWATINERDEDQYRRLLVMRETGGTPCPFLSPYRLATEGPPRINGDFVQPRSLRSLAIELPEELPKHLKKEITTFLDAVQEIGAQDFQSAFNHVQTRLGFARSESAAGSPFSGSSLLGRELYCGPTKKGFDLILSLEGVSPPLNRPDIDSYIDEKLGRGEEFGTERRWKLQAGDGFIIEHHKGTKIEFATTTNCLGGPDVEPPE